MVRSKQPSLVLALTEMFATLKRDFLAPYRPELHYMRGPGPRWHEKHGLRLQPVVARQAVRFPARLP